MLLFLSLISFVEHGVVPPPQRRCRRSVFAMAGRGGAGRGGAGRGGAGRVQVLLQGAAHPPVSQYSQPGEEVAPCVPAGRMMLSLPALVALAAILVAPSRAAQCPPPSFKTVDATCRWVLGRPVSCEVPATPGTKASFSCKPLYRLPLSRTKRPGVAEASICREDGTWAPLPFTCVPECGRLKGNGETLIVDGKPVNSPNEYPWHVAVYDKRHQNGVFQVCGGTLITPKFFVSAAHCFSESSASKKQQVMMRPASHFAAGVGKLKRDWAAAEYTAQTREIKDILTNGYGGARLNHVKDLALVEMVAAVDLTANTLPACVDWGREETNLQEGDVGTVVGWGNLRNSEPGQILQSASLPFVPKDKCLQLVPSQLVQYILLSDDRFCAGQINGTTVAHGDSGGGLSFPNREGRWFLQGVVSVGMPDMRTLTAFTNVSSFVRWMADKIEDEEIRAAAAEHHVSSAEEDPEALQVLGQRRTARGTQEANNDTVPVEIPKEYSASGLEEEQRVAYFREDVGLSLHHIHWHSYHPYGGAKELVAKDRRGELLYHMHAQLLARYNVERMSNHLQRTKRLNLREPIKEGYFPKLDNLVASRVWPGRPPETKLQDLNRDGMKISIEDLERWTARLYEAIAVGAAVDSTGRTLNLTDEDGIDLLGNLMESSVLSPNKQLYGELFNQGHILISLAHDPDNRFLESFGVMGDASVALRDPVFYRWQAYVQDLMRELKKTMPSYKPQEMDFPGVEVRAVDVYTEGSGQANLLLTHWQTSDLELSRGLDFSPRPPVFARLTHLQHQPFYYSIQVDNKGPAKEGYVRIFLAPKFDERGKPMVLDEQRTLMIEMDKFNVKLAPGSNMIRRRSAQSALTIPFERTFRDLDENRPVAGRALQEFLHCGCGWPQHMLLPRGTVEGMPFQLVVMVTDYKEDRVDQKEEEEGACNKAHIMCGVFGGRYPDRRPMGYPFDRPPRAGVTSLRAFLTPNMFAQSVAVRLKDVVQVAPRNATVFGAKNEVVKLPTPLGSVRPSKDKGPVVIKA